VADLTPDQFSDFFAAVHGTEDEPKRPFRWQERLAQDVLPNGQWPDVIRVPTACGKTSALDLAVFELALQASRMPSERTAPRRICFVVDRRLVVDEVTDHARRILRAVRSAVNDPHAAPVLRTVSDRLRALAPDGGEPLRLVRLRGGVYRDDG
jgi:CRISPR-associated endonuclease/helicase Cas3